MMTPGRTISRITDVLPDIKISTGPEDLVCYGFDASGLEGVPSAVVWPKNTEEVVRVMRYAWQNEIPVTPRGAGTGMTGGSIPLKGSIVLSFEKMNRLIALDTENLNVIVEPGLINGRLQRELEYLGFFYPPDPASMNFCTIGGNVAENAGGPRALKYGVTKDYVMELEAVLPNGEIITTGVRTSKGVVGYDLTRLLTGSEGTLAVITKIRLRILPLPEEVITLLVMFDNLEASGIAVSKIIASRVIPRTLEFMDAETIAAVESFKPVGIPRGVEALLLIELDGHPAAITKEAAKIADICTSLNAEVKMAEDAAARGKLWEARRAVSPALYNLNPTKINEDIVVPRNKIPDMLKYLKRLSEESGIKIVNFGHAGDGNIHVNIMVDRNDAERYRQAEALVKEIFNMTLDLGGTISGEHGVGITKASYISMEIKKHELALMKGIKNIFDPKGLLNPGKIFI
ncbi:MAG: FAD-linked oxidase C-terminal domain-containing protein [Thermodesulfovibrionales bacterium]|nr:FAD-linked oxidase C-terminal domain-containing protein [Thermodesulfovibrionales bacterium]MDP3111463.1 FAD-linked oxidase C-terminal domain-containing protein [Thermodesulfovibrionales bacterium]